MRNFKGIITIKIHLQIHHIASLPIASVSCDTTLFLCKKLTFQIKIYTPTRVSGSISLKFSRGNIDLCAP